MIINYGSLDYISKLGFICEVDRMKARNVSQFVLHLQIHPMHEPPGVCTYIYICSYTDVLI